MRGQSRVTIAAAAVLAGSVLAGNASAAPVVDGTRDAEYGPALAVQTVQTQFGDDTSTTADGGSELDAGYARIEGGKLYLMLTGNLETNFNKLEIFIDSAPGGQSTFDSSGNDNAQRLDGLVFDTGFTADYHVIARRGTSSGTDVFDVDFANLAAQTASGYLNVFGGTTSGSGTTGTGVNATGIGVGFNGSNIAGVTGGSAAADQTAAAAVTTGLELSFDLADLGYTSGPINIMVGVNGSGHDFWSNQFLGGLPAPQGNIGGGEGTFTGEGAFNLNDFAGNQYFTVVPEPATAGLLGLGGLALLARRGRRPEGC